MGTNIFVTPAHSFTVTFASSAELAGIRFQYGDLKAPARQGRTQIPEVRANLQYRASGKISSSDRSVPNKNYRNVKDFGEMSFKKNNLIDDDSETTVAESDSF